MISEQEVNYLRANPRFLVLELLRRGLEVNVLDWELSIIEVKLGERTELFKDIDSSLVPYSSASIASDKTLCKRMLKRCAIPVPDGISCNILDSETAQDWAVTQGFPLVLKPALGVQGEQVHMEIESLSELQHALKKAYEALGPSEMLLERQIEGNEYRIFITRTGQYAVLHRDPAYVIGNGVDTLRVLAEKESFRRMNPRINCLCPIELDQQSEVYLKKRGLSFEYIPASGEKVYLRGNSNVKTGGVARDCTEDIHPEVLTLAKNTLKAIPGLAYAGIDFLADDIGKPLSAQEHCVLEINSLPGIGMHQTINWTLGAKAAKPIIHHHHHIRGS